MKNRKIYIAIAALSLLALASSCQISEEMEFQTEDQIPISLFGDINQLAVTRASDNGFAAGDQVGIWAVNYDGDTPGELLLKGNQATNVRFTYDGSSWASDYDIYYKDKNTKVDIYGAYPYSSAISSIEAWPFEVQEDQSTVSAHGAMGGYEASDFLWAKRESVTPSPSTVQLLFQHKMSCVVVTLTEGSGFQAGEFASLSQSVLINNVKRNATINLATGVVTATGAISSRSTVPAAYENGFRAIVVPQTVSSSSTLFSITLGGVSYTYGEGAAFTYVAGKQHNFDVTVDKKADGGYSVTVNTTISAWTNDNSSHAFTAKEYVVVNVETPGTLGETLTNAGKNPDAIKYLKVLGTVDINDFNYIRDAMPLIQGVNMQKVRVAECLWPYGMENAIPDNAFRYKTYLNSFVFPESVTYIGSYAFQGTSLVGSVIIPNGVTNIGQGAFEDTSIVGVSLPESVVRIHGEAFSRCKYLLDVNIPNSLRVIDDNAFANTAISGTLYLPESLEYLGDSAFGGCENLIGKVSIPSKISTVSAGLFWHCAGITYVELHDGITKIGNDAFCGSGIKGEVNLPSQLVEIGSSAFSNTMISGQLVIPESLVRLGESAFRGCVGLEGTISIPESIMVVNSNVFSECTNIQGIILHKDVTIIASGAFSNCFQISSIICFASDPPYLDGDPFEGVGKDNFTVEVPESSVNDYECAEAWNEFKRIAAHREFSISRRLYRALNATESKTFTLRAEASAAWSIESKPEWVSVSPSSGSGKTDVTVTVSALGSGAGNRSGDVVFLLDGKDYRSTLTVEQYDYSYSDGAVITEQTHSKGNGVPIVFMGDCYDAADIASGSYLTDIREAIGYFFDIEPYKTYQNYFDISVVFGKSEDSGVGSVNTIREAKFGTQYSLTGGTLENDGMEAFAYARKVDANLDLTKALIVMVLNSPDYGGITYMWDDNSAIAICPKSIDPYPYDFRGLVQHEAGGHGFGKLADEYIYVNAFINSCSCPYPHLNEFLAGKANGWYKNLSEKADRESVPWSHLMYHPSYANTVDIYEGGYFHTRGIYRSESNSCMNNNIPYYSAISRQAIVERIMDYAGVAFDLEDFYENDVLATKAGIDASPSWASTPSGSLYQKHHQPVIMGKNPNL